MLCYVSLAAMLLLDYIQIEWRGSQFEMSIYLLRLKSFNNLLMNLLFRISEKYHNLMSRKFYINNNQLVFYGVY